MERRMVSMMSTKIPFTKQAVGYDQDQVDKYIQKLTDEYKLLHQKFTEMSERQDLIASQSTQPVIHTEAISKALVDAEVKAIQIVAEAKNEATRIIENAYMEIGQLQQARERTIGEINELVNGLKTMIPASPDSMARQRQPDLDGPRELKW
jgi:cell division septum initiation protein DivIVA